jgi:Coenzyme PQQ synthesis protein D (PqqD)
MPISFTDKVKVTDKILVSALEGESVLLNLESEKYFGLDEIGTRMLSLLNESNSVEAAYESLLQEYDVEKDVLRSDLLNLVEELEGEGLIEVSRER